jgi:hypothetical protein
MTRSTIPFVLGTSACVLVATVASLLPCWVVGQFEKYSAPGRVAPGGCPPGAPTDPYVLALEHTVPRITHSHARDERVHAGQGGPAPLSSGVSLTRCPDCDASDVFPSGGLMIRRPASLHAVPRCVRVPALQRYYQGAATSHRPSRRASFPSLGGAVAAFAFFAPAGLANARPAGLGSLGFGQPSCAEVICDGDDGISQVPGEPPLHLRRDLRPRQDRRRLTNDTTPWRGPRGGNVKGSCIAAFEAQSPGFGARCLRFAPAVARQGRKTRFRLLVRLCRAGFNPQGS